MYNYQNVIAGVGTMSPEDLAKQGAFCNSISTTPSKKMINDQKVFANAAPADLGYNFDITTLTEIRQQIIEQKFYEIAPADYISVKVGFGAFSDQLLTYRSYSTGDGFESGIVDTNTSKLDTVDTGFDAITTKIVSWAKGLEYNLLSLQTATKSGNWSLIEQKEKARLQNWQLGIQKIFGLGHSTDEKVTGLLNNPNVTDDTTTLTAKISSLSDENFQSFIQAFVAAYRANTGSRNYPDTFVIPSSDWDGLGRAASTTHPNITRREYLIREFREITRNPNAQVIPLAYCDAADNNLGLTRYVMYKNNEDTLAMNIPVDYTSTIAGTFNGFNFESAAYGQFTGVEIYRPKEVIYFSF